MTTFYLVRHASNDLFRHTLVGRMAGVHLNEAGAREAAQLARDLAQEPIHGIFSSPLERCRETAAPLAEKLKLNIEISEALNEMDFGDWTGKKFAGLDQEAGWKQWNACRQIARIPNGETMIEAQARMVGEVDRLRRRYPDQGVALFSHGDPLRAALCYFLGMPLELLRRLEVSPASVSLLSIGDMEVTVRCINWRGEHATPR